jgi:stage II sporulation protein M
LFLYLGWQVFSVGFLLASAIASYGFKGIILVITATFPHYLIYIPVYILCFFLAKTTYKRKRGERKYPIYLLLATALTLLYLLGIFLESYVNPRILTRILYFF